MAKVGVRFGALPDPHFIQCSELAAFKHVLQHGPMHIPCGNELYARALRQQSMHLSVANDPVGQVLRLSLADSLTLAVDEVAAPESPESPAKKAVAPVDIEPWRKPPPCAPGTSLMLRNIPNNYTRDMLRDLFDSRGFAGAYDFLYLPLDFQSVANLGYAFMNLVDVEHVESFWRAMEGFRGWSARSAEHRSNKVCRVEWNTVQGLPCLIQRYRNSPVMHPDVLADRQPLLLVDGIDSPFPPPTQPLKPPRNRKLLRKEPRGSQRA